MSDASRFHTIAPLLQQCNNDFPDHAALDALAQRHAVLNAQGMALSFVQPHQTDYEQRIYATGKVATRPQNWHDLFNAFAWLSFPRAKALLNRLHVEALAEEEGGGRSKQRDVLTLFDESGMVVLCADATLAQLLRGFQWAELFWQRRDAVRSHMRFHVFGHALHEQLLVPYKGITGKAVIVEANTSLLRQSVEVQLAYMDQAVCEHFTQPKALESTRSLQPVPVLGIPDWHPESENANYYLDTSHFRPGRALRKKKAPPERG
ncbi:MAG TPA: DUF3025 domain-containing protein [Burkholderiales bacterium]|nr:DUF3025 domain-containing protein [Burkholderiales bacterium]